MAAEPAADADSELVRARADRRRYRLPAYLALALVGVLTTALYWPNLEREFVFDSVSSIYLNQALHDVDVVRFFVDPTTHTNVRENADFRPFLMTVNALNYQVSGVATWSWHVGQIALHLWCGVLLFMFLRRVCADGLVPPGWQRDHPGVVDATVLLTVAVFWLQPINVGVVNYVSARSSMLVAALLLPAFWCYAQSLRTLTEPPQPLGQARASCFLLSAVGLFALALLTKAEAIAGLAVLASLEALYGTQTGTSVAAHLRCLWSRGALSRLTPMVLLAAAYLLARQWVMPEYAAIARQDADVRWWHYLLTQFTVWWVYWFKWLVPINLVGDDPTYPVFRQLLDLRVLASIVGWIALIAVGWRVFKRNRLLLFAALWFVALLSPTSSVLPLAEMLNEHRPYLPLAMAMPALLAPLCWWWLRPSGRVSSRLRRNFVVVAILGWLLVLALLTVDRMPVFKTRLAYYGDIIEKIPSARARVNYGLELAQKERWDEAEAEYRVAIRQAPYWYVTHLNLAKLYALTGRHGAAGPHFNDAVRYQPYGGLSRLERGLWHLSNRRLDAAESDLRASLPLLVTRERAYMGLIRSALARRDFDGAARWVGEFVAASPQSAEMALGRFVGTFATAPRLLITLEPFLVTLRRTFPGRSWP